MAGDWIKINSNLWDNPKVSEMCDHLDCGEAVIVGALFRLWSMADQHSEDGRLPMSMASVDRKTGVQGFADTLRKVGWLDVDEGGILIPEWESHHSQSAKRRSEDARRKVNSRLPKPKKTPLKPVEKQQPTQHVPNVSAMCPQNTGHIAELEKNRERIEKNIIAPASLLSDPQTKSENNPVLDLVDAAWKNCPAKGRNRSSREKVKKAFNQIQAKARPTAAAITCSMLAWAESPDWIKDGGEFVCGCHIWVKDKKWENPPEETTQKNDNSIF
tara:strand:+ start:856 stop:1671 length:816 start_codon:yes stop_codon:yes gene_type:complete